MKIYKKLFWVSLFMSLSSIALIIFCGIQANTMHQATCETISNIFIGIFSSSLLLFVNSIIGYKIEKERLLRKFHAHLLSIYSQYGTLEYNLPSTNNLLDFNSNDVLEIYKFLCKITLEDCEDMNELKNNISFLIPCLKTNRRFSRIITLINEYERYMGAFRESLHNHRNNFQESLLDIRFYNPFLASLKVLVKEMNLFMTKMGMFNVEASKMTELYKRPESNNSKPNDKGEDDE